VIAVERARQGRERRNGSRGAFVHREIDDQHGLLQPRQLQGDIVLRVIRRALGRRGGRAEGTDPGFALYIPFFRKMTITRRNPAYGRRRGVGVRDRRRIAGDRPVREMRRRGWISSWMAENDGLTRASNAATNREH